MSYQLECADMYPKVVRNTKLFQILREKKERLIFPCMSTMFCILTSNRTGYSSSLCPSVIHGDVYFESLRW